MGDLEVAYGRRLGAAERRGKGHLEFREVVQRCRQTEHLQGIGDVAAGLVVRRGPPHGASSISVALYNRPRLRSPGKDGLLPKSTTEGKGIRVGQPDHSHALLDVCPRRVPA